MSKQNGTSAVRNGNCFFIIFFLFFFRLGKSTEANFSVSVDKFLNAHQNSTLELECPRHSKIRAGSLYLTANKHDGYPTNGFWVRVRFPPYCPHKENYLIYINIKELNLNDGDHMTINSSTRTSLTKFLNGSRHFPHLNPTSVAQFLSEGPEIDINFVTNPTGSPLSQYKNPLILDYSLVHLEKGDSEDNCPALRGFQLHKLMCWESERVVCPTEYHHDPFTGNPALSQLRSSCSESSGPLVIGTLCGAAAVLLIGVPAFIYLMYRRRHLREFRYRTISETTNVRQDNTPEGQSKTYGSTTSH